MRSKSSPCLPGQLPSPGQNHRLRELGTLCVHHRVALKAGWPRAWQFWWDCESASGFQTHQCSDPFDPWLLNGGKGENVLLLGRNVFPRDVGGPQILKASRSLPPSPSHPGRTVSRDTSPAHALVSDFQSPGLRGS